MDSDNSEVNPHDDTASLTPEQLRGGDSEPDERSPTESADPESPVASPDAPREFAGYKIMSELGRGGMGVVYKAFDPKLKRTVALKVLLSAEHASEEEIQRFFREAESAAKLQHPNIVPVHDLEVFEGKHFYTMDYVEGEPLDRLIEERCLDFKAIATLMEKVSRGLEQAHTQGIVHRDLKPANIIIAPDGEPKITDFGLAKVIEAGEDEMTIAGLTGSGVVMGTPYYEAPEQAAGRSRDVDARTDVYALGCILYELLTGIPPFVAGSAMEILRMQMEDDPAAPSSRGVRVPADIETICLKCLEKEPRRRYQSAAELAAELKRFQEDLPVVARRASVLYVTKKRLLKHKTVVSIITVATLVLIAATGWYIKSLRSALVREAGLRRDAEVARNAEARQKEEAERRREEAEKQRKEAQRQKALAEKSSEEAQREADRARQVLKFLTSTLKEVAPEKSGREATVLELVNRTAKNVGAEFGEDPRVRGQVHMTLGNVYLALGKLEQSEKHINAGMELWKTVYAPDSERFMSARETQANLLHEQGKQVEAEKTQREVLAFLKRTKGAEHKLTLSAMNNLANTLWSMDKYTEAEKIHRQVLADRRRILGPEHRSTLFSMNNLGIALYRQKKLEEAGKVLSDALAISERALGKDYPITLSIFHNLSNVFASRGDLARCEELRMKVVEAKKRVMGPEHPKTLQALHNMIVLYVSQGRYAKAEEHCRKLLPVVKRVMGPSHLMTFEAMQALATALVKQGKLTEAETVCRQDLALRKKILGPEHLGTLAPMSNLATAFMDRGDFVQSERLYRTVLAVRKKKLGATDPATLRTTATLARLLVMQGKIPEGAGVLRDVLAKGPKNWKLWAEHSVLCAIQAKSEASRKSLARAKELHTNPPTVEAWIRKRTGILRLSLMGRSFEGRTLNNSMALVVRAVYRMGQKEWNKAAIDFEAAVKLDPSVGPRLAYRSLATLAGKTGDWKTKIKWLRKWAESSSDSATALREYAQELLTCRDEKLRDAKQALALARKAVAIKSDALTLDTLARAQFDNGKLAEAARDQGKAVALLTARASAMQRWQFNDRLKRYQQALQKK